MPFGIPLDDLEPGNIYEIHLQRNVQPKTCFFIQLMTMRKRPANLLLRPVCSPFSFQLSVKEIESIQLKENNADA